MSDVIAYYCGGTKPVLELITSIYSARRQGYTGEIVCCLGKTSVPHLQTLINSGEVTVIEVPYSENDAGPREHWCSRWRGMAMVNADRVLHPDCDMSFVKNPSMFFDLLHPEGDYMTTFHSVNHGEYFPQWDGNGSKNGGHIEEYQKVEPNFDINTPPFYIEMGILGWRGNWPWCQEVSDVCRITKDDQTAMSYVMMKHGRKAHKPELRNEIMRRARSYWRLTPEQYDAVIAWHCHPEYNMWWKFYMEAKEANYLGLADIPTSIYPKVDKAIKSGNVPLQDNRPT